MSKKAQRCAAILTAKKQEVKRQKAEQAAEQAAEQEFKKIVAWILQELKVRDWQLVYRRGISILSTNVFTLEDVANAMAVILVEAKEKNTSFERTSLYGTTRIMANKTIEAVYPDNHDECFIVSLSSKGFWMNSDSGLSFFSDIRQIFENFVTMY